MAQSYIKKADLSGQISATISQKYDLFGYFHVVNAQSCMFFIDLHTHQFSTESPQLAIKSIDVKAPNEAHLLAELEGSEPNQYFSLGLHPWYINPTTIEQDWACLQRLAVHPKVLMIGETGLDRLVATDWTFQIQVFRQHIALAQSLQKPLIIHCVRSFPEIIQCKKMVKNNVSWIIHGFNSNEQIMKQLLDKQFFISVGTAVLHNQSHTVRLLPAMPIEQLFLETDDKNCTISSIFAKVATIRGIDIEFLQEKIFENFKKNIYLCPQAASIV